MKTEATRIPEELSLALGHIATANRTSKGKILELALERLVAEVRETGRLPLPPMKFAEAVA